MLDVASDESADEICDGLGTYRTVVVAGAKGVLVHGVDVTPLHYLLGHEASHEAPSDPRKWGLVHYLQAFNKEMSKLDLELQRALAALPSRATHQRKVQVAADLRDVISGSAQWMLEHPRFAEFSFSRDAHNGIPRTQATVGP